MCPKSRSLSPVRDFLTAKAPLTGDFRSKARDRLRDDTALLAGRLVAASTRTALTGRPVLRVVVQESCVREKRRNA